MNNQPLKGSLFGNDIDFISVEELFDILTSSSKQNKKNIVGNVNVKGINIAYEDDKFREYLKKCDWVTIDGVGISIGLRMLGYNPKKYHRFTCPDYLDALLTRLSEENLSIFFLGGEPQVSEKLEKKIKIKHPDLNFSTHHGYFKKSGKENKEVINLINTFKPNILYIGFGMPLQEYWLLDNYDEINTNVFFPLGACIDFYTNTKFRGPKFITDNGLEWLIRLFTEPIRLWNRYVIGNPIFLLRVMKEKINR